MEPNYKVQGIVQLFIDGIWCERTFTMNVYGVDRSHAIDVALAWWKNCYHREEQLWARWYNQPAVWPL